MQKVKRYRTFVGVLNEAMFPVAGFIGVAGNFLENVFDHHVTTWTWFMPVVLIVLGVLSWRGLFSGIVVHGDKIFNRGLFRTKRFLINGIKNVKSSGAVVPLVGPHPFRNDVGVVLITKTGEEIDCPAVYGSSKIVDRIVAEIRQQVKEAKKERE